MNRFWPIDAEGHEDVRMFPSRELVHNIKGPILDEPTGGHRDKRKSRHVIDGSVDYVSKVLSLERFPAGEAYPGDGVRKLLECGDDFVDGEFIVHHLWVVVVDLPDVAGFAPAVAGARHLEIQLIRRTLNLAEAEGGEKPDRVLEGQWANPRLCRAPSTSGKVSNRQRSPYVQPWSFALCIRN